VFTRALGRALRRPVVARVPRPALRMAFGTDMADELILAGQRALPGRLSASGFAFRHPAIDGALAAVLAR